MDDFLSKPFREVQLVEVLNRWTGCSLNSKARATG